MRGRKTSYPDLSRWAKLKIRRDLNRFYKRTAKMSIEGQQQSYLSLVAKFSPLYGFVPTIIELSQHPAPQQQLSSLTPLNPFGYTRLDQAILDPNQAEELANSHLVGLAKATPYRPLRIVARNKIIFVPDWEVNLVLGQF